MLKRICAAAAAIFLLSSGSAFAAGSDAVRLSDLTRVAQHLSGTHALSAEETAQFDVTGNGTVDLTDLVRLAIRFTASAGAAAEPSLLSRAAAAEAALQYVPAGISADVLSTDLTWDLGIPCYAVRTRAAGADYTIQINGSTGELRRILMQRSCDAAHSGSPLTREQAAQAVLIRVPGAVKADIISVSEKTETAPVWAIELRTEDVAVAAKLVQSTGELIFWDEQTLAPAAPPLPTFAPSEKTVISSSEALRIALACVPQAGSADVVSCTLNENTLPAAYTVDIQLWKEERMIVVGAYDGSVLCDCMSRVPDTDLAASQINRDEAVRSVLRSVPGATESDTVSRMVTYMDLPALEVCADYRNVMYTAIFVQETGQLVTWNVETLLTHAVPDPLVHQAPFPAGARSADA